MEVTFDAIKNAANEKKHGISLAHAEEFDMASAFIEVDDREEYGEVRYNALGFIAASLHSFTFTIRDEEVRAISLRKQLRKSVIFMPRITEMKGSPDAENPEWTKERVQKAKRLSELPSALQTILAPKNGRGLQKAPTKKPVSLRVSQDVLEALKATGSGWQTRADEALREAFITAKKRA